MRTEINYLSNGDLPSNSSIKEKVLLCLKEKEGLTQSEISQEVDNGSHKSATIHWALAGLMSTGFVKRTETKPYLYFLTDTEILQDYKVVARRKKKSFGYRSDELPPEPSAAQVEYWLKQWNELEDYVAQEKAIDKLFHGDFNSNDDIQNILIKCSVLNDFYSTNIFKVYPVAKHILSLNIDDRLRAGDPTLVDDIAKVELSGKEKNFYSFASKYCSHHNELEFPIYDSYVHSVLIFFRDTLGFSSFDASDLKVYPKFKGVLQTFRSFFGLESYNLKQLDRYLWQSGKFYFPKKYY